MLQLCEKKFLSPTYTEQQIWKKSIQEEGGEDVNDLEFIDDSFFDPTEELGEEEFLALQNSIFNNKPTNLLLTSSDTNTKMDLEKDEIEIDIEESDEDEEEDSDLFEENCWVELVFDDTLNVWK